jgi:hypothetical protein
MKNHTAIAQLIFVVAGCCPSYDSHPIQQKALPQDVVEVAIKQLWSSDEKVRLSAKEKLIQFGSEAIEPVLALLEEVTTNEARRFMTGKEQEGAEAWKRVKQAEEIKDSEQRDKLLSGKGGLIEKAFEYEITVRLKWDSIEILGRLRAEKAIPLLIEQMLLVPKLNWLREYWNPAMEALAEIGPAAVPKLIETIEKAREEVSSGRFSSPISDEQRQYIIESFIITRQTRAVMVLGRIGDARALPFLSGLPEVYPMRYYVKEAIKNIIEKTK